MSDLEISSTSDHLGDGSDAPRGRAELPAECLELESFYRAGRFLSAVLDLDQLLRAILEEALDAVGGNRGFIGLVDRSRGELELRITAGQGWERAPSRRLEITDAPGSGITVQVVCTGVPYVSGDVRQDPHYVMFFPDVRSEIAAPLVNRDGRVIGVINVESEQVDAFSQRDLQLLGAVAAEAAIAISVANYRAREAALIEIGNELASSTDMDELLNRVVLSSARILRADECSIFQLDPSRGRLVLRATSTQLASHVGTMTYALGEGLTGWVAEHRELVRVPDVREDPRWRGVYPALTNEIIEAYMGVPVFQRSELWGVLRVARRKPASSIIRNDFTERDEKLLSTLAKQVGAAVTQQTLIASQLQMERMAAWGEMSARSAHMIGNKVFALKGQLNELGYLAKQPEFSPDVVTEVVRRATQSVFQLEEILTEFRDFLMATHLDRRPADLNELVQTVARETLPRSGVVTLEVETAEGLPPVSLDPARFRRALSELLENAVNHQAEGGAVRVITGPWTEAERSAYPDLRVPPAWREDGAAVRVEVLDRGPGIPEENKSKLFTPFFTTRSKGMGLGLSIVKGIIDAHQGVIAEVGRLGEGAHFLIVLPTSRYAAPPAPEPVG
ncbi:MAG: GAF domain-containing protein [Armatimonadota bacterium]